MMDFATSCSLGVVTRIDLPQERTSLIPTVSWYQRERGHAPYPGAALNLSIGQGELLLTPLALARFFAAVVDDGNIRRPHVVSEIRSRQGEQRSSFEPPSRPVGRLPASRANLSILRTALEGAVMDPRGTGKRARVGTFRIGGKTGTAENPHGEDHAVFVGYAPAEDPNIVVAVVIEVSGHGGAIAAPVAQKVLDAYLNPASRPIAEAVRP
jgi:penicillin-binding protein 2